MSPLSVNIFLSVSPNISILFYPFHVHVSPSCQVLLTFVIISEILFTSISSLFPQYRIPVSGPCVTCSNFRTSFVMDLLASSLSLTSCSCTPLLGSASQRSLKRRCPSASWEMRVSQYRGEKGRRRMKVHVPDIQ